MPSIGATYNPIIEAALADDRNSHELLKALGRAIFEANPDVCPNVEDGMRAARENLDYYVQYFSPDVAARVKGFYGLGTGFRAIDGSKLAIPG